MKKLIIVCEEKRRGFGDFLSQLISRKDDNGETVIGTKDGTVAAQVWTEKEYEANSAQISSEQYILFIGNSKLIKDKRSNIINKFSEYGMNYGWLGKQSFLFVDHIASKEEYDDFYNYACDIFLKGNQDKIDKVFDNDQQPLISFKPNETTDEKSDSEDEPKSILGSVLKHGEKFVKKGTEVINKTTVNVDKVTKNRNIENQQYNCLILMFYLKDLSVFLELNEG